MAGLRAEELAAGLQSDAFYLAFTESARATKRDLLKLLVDPKDGGARICGYGAGG